MEATELAPIDATTELPPEAVVWGCVADRATQLREVITPVSIIVVATGLPLEVVSLALDDLAAPEIGLVSTWTAMGEDAATLTPLAARRLGLRLSQTSNTVAAMKWVDASSPIARERRRRGRVLSATDAKTELDSKVGRDARPDDIVAESEEIERDAARPGRKLSDAKAVYLPSPTIILTGCQAWKNELRPICPVCRNSPLGPTTYCAKCGRWGLDWLLERNRRAEAS